MHTHTWGPWLRIRRCTACGVEEEPMPADGEQPADDPFVGEWLAALRKGGCSEEQIERARIRLAASPGSSGEDDVITAEEIFAECKVAKPASLGSSGGEQLTDLNGRELNAASVVLELHLSKVRHPSPQSQDVERVARVLRRLAGGVEAER